MDKEGKRWQLHEIEVGGARPDRSQGYSIYQVLNPELLDETIAEDQQAAITEMMMIQKGSRTAWERIDGNGELEGFIETLKEDSEVIKGGMTDAQVGAHLGFQYGWSLCRFLDVRAGKLHSVMSQIADAVDENIAKVKAKANVVDKPRLVNIVIDRENGTLAINVDGECLLNVTKALQIEVIE